MFLKIIKTKLFSAIVFMIYIAILVLFITLDNSAPTPREDRREQQQASTQSNCSPNHIQNNLLLKKALPTEINGKTHQNKTHYENKCPSYDHQVNIICTIFNTISTIIIAIFTTYLYLCNRNLFIATHRPKLRVHSLFLEKLDSISFREFPDGDSYKISFSIENIGVTVATITKVSISVQRFIHDLPRLSYSEFQLVKKTIRGGETIVDSHNIAWPIMSLSKESVVNDLYFFGYIDYQDSISTIRRTAFCRRYIRETKRFVTVEDEDYEYNY
ncbi:MAG: hypothetical protein AB7U45_00050 [Desulfamplus sp.]